MNREPTEQQIKELWKWCRVRAECQIWDCFNKSTENCSVCQYWEYPPINLNSLFKWSVPQLFKDGFWLQLLGDGTLGWDCRIHHLASNDNFSIYQDKDLAIALFWAIYKIAHDVNKVK